MSEAPRPLTAERRSVPAHVEAAVLRALYNNLKKDGDTPAQMDGVAELQDGYMPSGDLALDRALKIDAAVKKVRPDAWRGVQAREQVIKKAPHEVLRNRTEVERIFLIIKAQGEY